jgi:hypothetical protein
MNTLRWGLASIVLGALALVSAGCGAKVEGGGSDGGGGGGGGSGGGALQWYTTCGDPVCMEPDGGAMPPSGVNPCTTEKVGDACTTSGAKCWPSNSTCGELLICATKDPKNNPGGCPISGASHKKDISYVPESELLRLHDDVMSLRLSTWRYKDEPAGGPEHLGFIIEDAPASPAVAPSGERVDLYGYTSMAVAAAQVQNKKIEAMERELSAMRAEMAALREKVTRCEGAR